MHNEMMEARLRRLSPQTREIIEEIERLMPSASGKPLSDEEAKVIGERIARLPERDRAGVKAILGSRAQGLDREAAEAAEDRRAFMEGTEKITHRDADLAHHALPPRTEPGPADYLQGVIDKHYKNSMRIAAAMVLSATGSLDTAASHLKSAWFRVPPGYFDEDDPLYLAESEDPEALQAWVEREQDAIRRIVHTEAFKQAVEEY